MILEIITIGDEILIGQTVDTNSAWMGANLNKHGFAVGRITSIADQREEIIQALTEAGSRVNLVLMTGGLGPTADDITKRTLAEYFETTLVRDPEILEHVKHLFSTFGVEMPEVNKKQADVPANCTVLHNPNGTAPGMWFEKDGTIYVSMPGVPYEMKGLMEGEVIPRIKVHFKTPTIVHQTVVTAGVGESTLMELIGEWETRLRNDGLSLAYLPSAGSVKLRVSGSGEEEEVLQHQVNTYIDELRELIPQHIIGYNEDKLEEVIGQMLLNEGATLSTAESCTGGYIAHLITSVAGSSAYFEGSVVSYSNEVKETVLGVSWQSLKDHGAVSKQVVEEMAEGAKRVLKTTYAIATSGVAGPGGGTEEKPVGTVWVAVAGPQGVFSKMYTMGKHRQRNIRKSALAGLHMLRKSIQKVAAETVH